MRPVGSRALSRTGESASPRGRPVSDGAAGAGVSQLLTGRAPAGRPTAISVRCSPRDGQTSRAGQGRHGGRRWRRPCTLHRHTPHTHTQIDRHRPANSGHLLGWRRAAGASGRGHRRPAALTSSVCSSTHVPVGTGRSARPAGCRRRPPRSHGRPPRALRPVSTGQHRSGGCGGAGSTARAPAHPALSARPLPRPAAAALRCGRRATIAAGQNRYVRMASGIGAAASLPPLPRSAPGRSPAPTPRPVGRRRAVS